MAVMIKAALAEERPQRGAISRVARDIGTTYDILSNLANGRTRPESHKEVIEALRKRYRKPIGWPFDVETNSIKPVASAGEAAMSYVGRVSAGEKVLWSDPYESDDFEFVPSEMVGKGRFCCRIDGDSMFDLLHPDDLCVFQQHLSPRLGLVVMYRNPTNTVTIKQLRHNGEGFYLHPLNPAYQDEPAVGTCVGYLVGVVRRWGSRSTTVYDPQGIAP